MGDETVSVERVATGDGEVEIEYAWPTRLLAHELLGQCTPFIRNGHFVAKVEVTVFSKEKGGRYDVLEVEEYLKDGAQRDARSSSVRFIADAFDHFSVTWFPVDGKGDLRGRAVATFGDTPDMMEAMMQDSVVKSAAKLVAPLIQHGRTLDPGIAA